MGEGERKTNELTRKIGVSFKSFVSIDCPVNQEGALPTCCNV
jgi:hypothetical protein